jgi:Flp pilus assembly pilin Flp
MLRLQKEAITMIQKLQGFWQDETGQDLIEYLVIIVTVLVIAVPLLNQIMTHVRRIFEGILRELGNYHPGS